MSDTIPLSVTADRHKRELTVTWGDGHTSVYPFGLLRAACPCASCRGGHEKMSSEPDAQVFDQSLEDSPATRMVGIEGVGSYAITIEWEDGHHYGIYNWHYLRMLCPCPVCQKEYGYGG